MQTRDDICRLSARYVKSRSCQRLASIQTVLRQLLVCSVWVLVCDRTVLLTSLFTVTLNPGTSAVQLLSRKLWVGDPHSPSPLSPSHIPSLPFSLSLPSLPLSLSSPSPCPSLPSHPSPPVPPLLEVGPLNPARRSGGALFISSPSWVWGGAPAEIELGAF